MYGLLALVIYLDDLLSGLGYVDRAFDSTHPRTESRVVSMQDEMQLSMKYDTVLDDFPDLTQHRGSCLGDRSSLLILCFLTEFREI